MKKNKLSKMYLLVIMLVMCFAGCKEKDDALVVVKSITFDKTELTILEGGDAELIATIAPDDAENKELTWGSSNTSIATVDNNGKVIAVKEGSATITATSVNKVSATCAVTVTKKAVQVTGVSLDEVAIVLAVGAKDTLKATVRPDDATNKKVLWSSNNTAVATVKEDGEITAVKEGTATITATTEDGGKTATCAVTVTLTGIIDVTSVTLDETDITMHVGAKKKLTATVSPTDATDKTIVWDTSDKDVVTVDNGEITAIATGIATITATAGEKTAECIVTVIGSLGNISIDNAESVTFVTGCLSEKLNNTVTKIVFGEGSELNGSDIKAMAELRYSLEHLDMTKATIVEGGGNYESGYGTIPYNIGDYMFQYMDKLKTVLLPANTIRIRTGAFEFCPELISGNIPEGVKEIGSIYLNSTMESLMLPASLNLKNLHSMSLGYLNNINVADGNTDMKSIDGVVFSPDEKTLCVFPRNRSSYSVPEGVTTLRSFCFSNALITTLNLPASLKTIEANAIAYTTNLTTLTIPANVTTISTIAENDNLTTIIVNAVTPPTPTGSDHIFGRNEKLTAIYVPDESLQAYKASNWWDERLIKPMSEMK